MTGKELADQVQTKTAKQLKKACSEAACVSFDIFDTLVYRKQKLSEKSSAFAQLEKTYQIADFERKRKAAEKQARSQIQKHGGEDVTLEEIYACYEGISEREKHRLAELECSFARGLYAPREDIKKLYELCRSGGKRIILVSDMYLPRSCIEDILHSCGYNGYERLFLSCEYRQLKYTGSLFRTVLKTMELPAGEILHIGDHITSDYRRPMQLGIKAVKLRTATTAQMRGWQHARVAYQSWGCTYLGPVLAGYSQWLYDGLKKKGISRVYFLSRDGELMKKAFARMGFAEEFDVHYLYVSRQSLKKACLWMAADIHEWLKLLPLADELSLKEISDYFSLDMEKSTCAAAQAGLHFNQRYSVQRLSKDKRLIVWWQAMKDCFEQYSREQFDFFLAYLAQEKFEGRVAIVDIGWRGNMQQYLDKIVKKSGADTRIEGYYLGLNSYARTQPKWLQRQMNAYLFFDNYDYETIDVNAYIGLLELFFTNADGSVVAYKQNAKGKTLPVFEENLLEREHPKQLRQIAALQNGALNYVHLHGKRIAESKQSSLALYRPLHKQCTQPNREMMRLFSHFYFKESRLEPLFEKKSRRFYVQQPAALLADFKKATWKAGFLKHVLFFAPPYADALCAFQKVYRPLTKLFSSDLKNSSEKADSSADCDRKGETHES